ncbi:MAG: hypothetical protein KDD99_27175 [Bacteroidetes bacterium]|nr:hypothetical protein [Bacteroidota bacterium]
MKHIKNHAEQFFFMGLIGLHITLILQVMMWWFTDISFWASMASFGTMYPTWIGFFVAGVVGVRRKGRQEVEMTNRRGMTEEMWDNMDNHYMLNDTKRVYS